MDTVKIIEAIQTWVLDLLLTLAAGTGWIKYFLERRDRNRERARARNREALEVALRIHKRFVQTQRIAQEIMHELGVEYLEYKPGALRDILESDATSHPIETWQRRFKRLHDLNAEARNLYMNYPGMLDTELRAALDKFVFHADQWHDYWRDLGHETPRVDERGLIVANPFPKEVIPALESEIEKLEGLA